MTLIAAVVLSNGEVGIWGDSIVTRTSPDTPVIAGVTSQDERVQVETVKDEGVRDYVEAACKVGRFGSSAICGLATSDTDFAFTILDLLAPELYNPSTPLSLLELGSRISVSLSDPGESKASATAEYILFIRFQKETFYFKIRFDRQSDGHCCLTYPEPTAIKEGDEWIDFAGSGRETLDKDLLAGIQTLAHTYYLDRTLQRVFPSLVSNYLSAEVRRQQQYEASGVGGLFFGFVMTKDQIIPSSETIHIFADETETIRIYVKVLYRDSIFTAKNFLSGDLGKFSPLEIELAQRQGKIVGTSDSIAAETNRLEAESTLFDVRTKEYPAHPNVRIYDCRRGNGCFYTVEGDEKLDLGMRVDPKQVINVDFGDGKTYFLRIRK